MRIIKIGLAITAISAILLVAGCAATKGVNTKKVTSKTKSYSSKLGKISDSYFK